MDWTVWTMFVVTEGVLVVAPGPAVLFVVAQGLRTRSARALWSAIGILTANAFFFALSGTGLGALLAASPVLFTVVKWAGAAYLFYLGAASWLRPRSLPQARGPSRGTETRCPTLFVRGLVLQLSNPKALLFFTSILPQFIDREQSILFQLLVLGVTSILLELAVLSAYGVAAARASRLVERPRFAIVTGRVSGLLLMGSALGLAQIDAGSR